MKRKMLARILALTMALSLTACGGEDAAVQEDDTAPEDQTEENVQVQEPEAPAANYTVVESQLYSEGLAWVLYRDEGGRIWVDVDPRSDYAPCLCTITDVGEPCDPMRPDIEVEFYPCRDVWY